MSTFLCEAKRIQKSCPTTEENVFHCAEAEVQTVAGRGRTPSQLCNLHEVRKRVFVLVLTVPHALRQPEQSSAADPSTPHHDVLVVGVKFFS